MADTPEMQSQLVSAHGMLAILEVLEGRSSRDVTLKLLQIVNAVWLLSRRLWLVLIAQQLVTTDMGFLESFCLIGFVLLYTTPRPVAYCIIAEFPSSWASRRRSTLQSVERRHRTSYVSCVIPPS